MRRKADSRGRLPSRLARRRRGTLILELVLVLPLILIALLAAIQFGKYFANMQEISLAARIGGLAASRTANLSAVPGDPVPTTVVEAVNKQLTSVGIPTAAIALEHNLDGCPILLKSPQDVSVDVDLISAPPPGRYVRVIVIVPQAALMPDLLRACGLHLVLPGKITAFSNVFQYAM
ncbi:MAG: hypothetical protein GYA33_09200 [Thermogutta sp.]|nr:hypothetical protein [Thermogutta sp.]